jgi:hypothetical protein
MRAAPDPLRRPRPDLRHVLPFVDLDGVDAQRVDPSHRLECREPPCLRRRLEALGVAALVKEQGGRCAFCERRICDAAPATGRQKPSGHTAAPGHCDVYQEERAPPVDAKTPAEDHHGAHMKLLSTGELEPSDGAPAHVQAIIDLFNLNHESLCAARNGAVDGLRMRLDKRRPGVAYTRERLQGELDSLAARRPNFETAQRLWLERQIARR